MSKLKFFIRRFVVDSTIVALFVLSASPLYSLHGDLAEAEGFTVDEYTGQTFPYTKTFTISAYYSPLPCQSYYTTGSYEGDKRLNGNGTNGADGTPVYPGMIAAPKSYSFGTKMYIPGVGITAVHDRGGAIVEANSIHHDRLDIWMGYGDKGLTRALQWGKRNVEVTVYGINDGVSEQISLGSYSPSEAIPQDCSFGASDPHKTNDSVSTAVITHDVKPPVVAVATAQSKPVPTSEPTTIPETKVQPKQVTKMGGASFLKHDLVLGDSGEHIEELQRELAALNYYRGPITGFYGELTEHSVFKFQQSQGLVGNKSSLGAGAFGPKTRERMNELIANRSYTKILVASSSVKNSIAEVNLGGEALIAKELDMGISDPTVAELQEFLRKQGFYNGGIITEYYGPLTQQAVLDFQIAHEIVSSSKDLGAGRVGPLTLSVINNLS